MTIKILLMASQVMKMKCTVNSINLSLHVFPVKNVIGHERVFGSTPRWKMLRFHENQLTVFIPGSLFTRPIGNAQLLRLPSGPDPYLGSPPPEMS